MRKITIGFIVLAILALTAFLIVSCTAKTETQIVEQTQPVETGEQPAAGAGLLGDGETTETKGPVIEDPVINVTILNYDDNTVDNFFADGFVTENGLPIEVDVVLHCGSLTITRQSDEDGEVSFIGISCVEGSEAWLQVGSAESDHVIVDYPEDSGSGAPRTFSLSAASPAGVPEFSIITLGLAVVIGGLGLAYLRKN